MAEKIDDEKRTKLKGRSIVSGERLQERLGDAISCCFCQGDVNIMEKCHHEMDLILCGLFYANMKAAHPKALIQPSQQLRRGRVLRAIGQRFSVFDLPVLVMLRP